MASNITLQACLSHADQLETSLSGLGDISAWPAYGGLIHRCAQFRQECQEMVCQKGVGQLAMAFIGPKNAGKTTLLSLFVRNDKVIRKLHPGGGLAGATEKVTWISTQPLRDLDWEVEENIAVDAADLINLGCDYTLVDVPGANEANLERAAGAQRALRAAHVKVLVMDARTLEDTSIIDYLENADGATILPVINQIRPGTDDQDIAVFMATLKNALPGGNVLPPIRIPDFQLVEDAEAGKIRKRAAADLRQHLEFIVKEQRLDDLLEPQLVRLKAKFTETIQQELTQALPATARAAREILDTESTISVKALELLLGADDHNRVVMVGLRQQLRSIFQQRTPVLFFPWSTFVGLANLLYGALEKVPLVLVGSLPSLASSAMTAMKNAARDREFSSSQRDGLRKHAELLVKESLHPKVDQLEAAIRSDLRSERRTTSDEALEVEFEGLDILQTRSSALFTEVLESRASSRSSTWATGIVGLLIFWALFSWPMVSLYKDYFAAIDQLISGNSGNYSFPSESLPVLTTGFLLASVPMMLWMTVVLSWAGSSRRARECLGVLRAGHQCIIEELNAGQLLKVRADHPHLRSCLKLFSLRS